MSGTEREAAEANHNVVTGWLGAFAFQGGLAPDFDEHIGRGVSVCLFGKPQVATGKMIPFSRKRRAVSGDSFGAQLGSQLAVFISGGHLRPKLYAQDVF